MFAVSMEQNIKFGIIGGGSWATALAKILTDNNHLINWWIRNEQTVQHILRRHHNPHYLSSAYFDTSLLKLSHHITEVIKESDVVIIAVPSAYVSDALKQLPADAFQNKKIVSAIKGIVPETNQLLNEFLQDTFDVSLDQYFTVLGPCHAEEVAAEKLSYLTFSGLNEEEVKKIAVHFNNAYMNTVVNHDVLGVQYAAILKNIYALGAGIAHGLEYGDNFLSVYIANCTHEMIEFLRKILDHYPEEKEPLKYASSVYLGDLLVTCYSLYSRNRMFGNMIGKGYSVKAAQLELNMVAEGFYAAKCIHKTNIKVQAELPFADTIFRILWENQSAEEGFKRIENLLT
ncbi:MAG: glycerol-3-phosphate dehydrogenase [Chitinophagaceae bacterium]|nr:glycerol-3-phosphate dehydrogenase [Chitinophagaceae bacterium]